MYAKSQTNEPSKINTKQAPSAARNVAMASRNPGPGELIQLAAYDPTLLSYQNFKTLQRTIGNRAVGRLLGAHKASGGGVIQRLTERQSDLLTRFRQGLKTSAVAALQVLSQSPTMTDFREVVKQLTPAEVDDLMKKSRPTDSGGLLKEVLPYSPWLGEVRNELIAYGAESLAGKLNWVTSGAGNLNEKVVPKEKGKTSEGKEVRNDFTAWLRGLGGPPEDTSNMNCWEACLYAGFKVGALHPRLLYNIYEIAKEAGQQELDSQRGGSAIIAAYTNAIAAVLGTGEEQWHTGNAAPPRGYLVFFNGPSHVAVSRGFLDPEDHTPAIMSLWNKPGPKPVMQETTIGKILSAASSDYEITFGPAPM